MCNFGDLKFYTSRAFLDEDDDDDCHYNLPSVTLHMRDSKPANISTTLVFFGDLSTAYCKEILDDTYQPIGTITASYGNQSAADSSQDHSIDQSAPGGDSISQSEATTDKPITVAELFSDGDTLVSVCYDKRDNELSNMVAREILSLLHTDSSSCTVYTTQHMSKLRAAAASTYGDACDAPVVMHCLTTPDAQQPLHHDTSSSDSIRPLPQPAFVDALPAAVLTACLLKKVPCVVYIAYTETISKTDVSSVKEQFNQVLALQKNVKGLSPVAAGGRSCKHQSRLQHSTFCVPDNYI